MKKRFALEQIIGVLKEADAGRRWPSCPANTASAMQPTTAGKPNFFDEEAYRLNGGY